MTNYKKAFDTCDKATSHKLNEILDRLDEYDQNASAIDAATNIVNNSNLSSTYKITRAATIVIAAFNSTAAGKASADYVCDGAADNVELQTALNELPTTGGEIHLLDGTYQLAATIERDIDNVSFTGNGYSTYIKCNNSIILFSIGVQKNWIFRSMRLDFGGLELETGSSWSISDIWQDDSTSAITTFIDKWSDEYIAPNSAGNFMAESHRHPLISELVNFQDSNWSITTGTLTYDTIIKRNHSQSAKIVTVAGTNSKINRTSTLPDLTDCAFGVWVYTPDSTKISAFRLYRYTTGGSYNYCIRYPFTINDGWMFIVFDCIEEHVYQSPDPSSPTSIHIQVEPASGQVATVYIDSVYYWKRAPLAPNGIVTMTFDDGYTEVETLAKPKFDVYDYKGVQSLIISRLTPEKIQSAKNLQANGWDITSHSYDHGTHTQLIANSAKEYLLSQKWLADNGFKNGSAFTVLARGSHDAKMINYLNNNLMLSRSYGITGGNVLPAIGNLILTYHVTYETSVAGAKTWIDAAKANHTWINICFHTITITPASGYDWSPTQIEELLAYCNSTGIEVLTYSQIVDRIRSTAQNLTLSGTGTITNGTTSVNIRHGFHKTPSSIQVTQTSSLGTASSIWISSKDTGTGNLFTVSVDIDPGQDVTFEWTAKL